MSLKVKTRAVPLIALIVAFAGITCVNQEVRELGTEAELTALQIVSGDVTDTTSKVGLPIRPELMVEEDYQADELYGLDYDQPDTTIGWADIRVVNKDTGKISGRIRPTVSFGARTQWGIGTRSTRPDAFFDTRVPAELDSGEFIYIRVDSEDGEKFNYYRFETNLLSWSTNLQYIRIGSREAKAGADIHGNSTGASSWDKVTTELSLSIAQREGQGALVEATPFDEKATVKYALVTGAGAPGNYTPAEQRLNIRDQDFLYVEVTAQNTIDKEYFKFKVSVGRIASIASLVLTGGPQDYQVYGLGVPQADWGQVGASSYETADQPDAVGFGIALTSDDIDAKISYGKIASDTAGQPVWGNPAKLRFDGTEALAVKVVSANDLVTWFYKIKVVNLAARIKTHPKAAWYYRADVAGEGASLEGKQPVAALTVEMDRAPKGTWQYQWYEADSWYGLYGRHGTPLDEKNNITTVNGGPGQYFYLVQPNEDPYNEGGKAGGGKVGAGSVLVDSDYWADMDKGGEPMAWILTGETNSTYTPKIEWIDNSPNLKDTAQQSTQYWAPPTQNNSYPRKPAYPYVNFLSGSTCESRYYWVKVTDSGTGLSVVSQRALIITETDPRAEHFIFDLSILPKKNEIPFVKEGTDSENVYRIDLKEYPWPVGFNPSKYEICIAHAQYFLPDGRPWTQNWTHGNLHFGMDDNSLKWYHNNMGANGGSIPLQAPHSSAGGLTSKPDWIGFTPSGDPAKGLPAPVGTGNLPKGIYSMNATDPYPAGVAQGYFAGFIELLEVRFATAPK